MLTATGTESPIVGTSAKTKVRFRFIAYPTLTRMPCLHSTTIHRHVHAGTRMVDIGAEGILVNVLSL